MALNFRVLTIGGLTSFVGSLLWKVQESPWVRGNLPSVSEFIAGQAIALQFVVLFGAVIVAFGLFWGRWFLASIFGAMFALGIYVLTFW